MTFARKSVDLLMRLRGFARAQRGIAAVEFALVLPLMLTAYLGGIELGDGVAINRKVTITTRAVADLATRYTTIRNADMANILGASSAIIAPYASSPLAVTVSEVTVDANGNATITWSDTLNGSARAVGSPVTLPGTLGAATGTPFSFIWGEVKYAYTPALSYVLTGKVTLTNQMFMSPRRSVSIIRINS